MLSDKSPSAVGGVKIPNLILYVGRDLKKAENHCPKQPTYKS